MPPSQADAARHGRDDCTAHSEGLEEEAHEAGAQRVLSKPIDFPRLLNLVKKALMQAN